MISFRHKGDFTKTKRYLDRTSRSVQSIDLDKYGSEGVAALSAATPVDTGKTASSWYYKITKTKDSIRITFNNSNIVSKVPIAIILQYGHGTRQGGWVEGRDYINPVAKPLFDKIVENAWREVTKL